jgi:hypothetical protein
MAYDFEKLEVFCPTRVSDSEQTYWQYRDKTATLAQMTAADFFVADPENDVDKAVLFKVDDLMFLSASDGVDTVTITAISPSIVISGASDKLALPLNEMFLGDSAGNAVPKAMSGDASIVASGALTIANNAITDVKILNEAVIAAKIKDLNVTTAKIDDDAVTNDKIPDSAISKENLDVGIQPQGIIIDSGIKTTVGGNASEVFSSPGTTALDGLLVFMRTEGAAPVSIIHGETGVADFRVQFTGDPLNDHQFSYIITRLST